jgi:signal transduction histidine kinase
LVVAAGEAPNVVKARWLMPAAIVITVISAIRLGTTPTAIVATIMTVGVGIAILPRPTATTGLVDAGSAWAIGMSLAVLMLTLHVLLAQWREAQQNLRAAEFAHRMEVLDAARAEQERLSREMHDALGQELTAVSLLAHTLVRKLSIERPELIDDARLLAETADQAHRTAREIARGMVPRFMDGDDIGAALRTLADRLGRTSRIAVVLDIEPGPPLPRHVAETVYRVAQEALSNALNHANASCIQMRLRYDATHCHLEIDDNGRGFDPAEMAGGHGLGLRTMGYRCDLAGGRLQLDSAPQAGTRVRVTLPLGLHAAAEAPPRETSDGLHATLPKPSTG